MRLPNASGSGPLNPHIVPGTKTREGSESADAPDMASMTSLSSRPGEKKVCMRDERERG